MAPEQIWPIACFSGLLILTLEMTYFPTAGLLMSYAALMIYKYDIRPTAIEITIAVIEYIIGAAIWFFIKFWSFLRESRHVEEIKGISPGHEKSYLRKYAGYLYLHVLYWPLSLPYTIYTRIIYQMYITFLEKVSGMLGRMIARRREQLKNM